MSKLSVWFASPLLVVACACSAPHLPTSVGARNGAMTARDVARSEDSSEGSESSAWDSALDDAREAAARAPDARAFVAVRLEGLGDQHAADAHDGDGRLAARVWIDGKPFDGATAGSLDDPTNVVSGRGVDAGRHTLRVEIVAMSEGSSTEVAHASLAVDVGPDRTVVVRAMLSREDRRSLSLALGSLDARRLGLAEKASMDQERIDADIRKVQASLAERRRDNDPRYVRCVSDELSQILVAKRSADEDRTSLVAALASGQPELAARIASKLTVKRRRVEKLAGLGRQCPGTGSSLLAVAYP